MFMSLIYTQRCVLSSTIVAALSTVYAPLRINSRKIVVKLSAMAPKNAAAVALGRRGGKATAEKRTPEQRSEAARRAVEARWAKTRELVDDILVRSKALEKKAIARKAQQK